MVLDSNELSKGFPIVSPDHLDDPLYRLCGFTSRRDQDLQPGEANRVRKPTIPSAFPHIHGSLKFRTTQMSNLRSGASLVEQKNNSVVAST